MSVEKPIIKYEVTANAVVMWLFQFIAIKQEVELCEKTTDQTDLKENVNVFYTFMNYLHFTYINARV